MRRLKSALLDKGWPALKGAPFRPNPLPPFPAKEENLVGLSGQPKSGTQDAGEPKAYGGGQKGVQGAKPHGGGLWGVSPHKTKRGGELPTLATPPRVGPNTLANPKPTGVGKRGSRGAVVGVPLRPNPLTPFPAKEGKIWRGYRVSLRVGPRTLANPKPTGVGKRSPRGRSPLAGGLEGCAPTKF